MALHNLSVLQTAIFFLSYIFLYFFLYCCHSFALFFCLRCVLWMLNSVGLPYYFLNIFLFLIVIRIFVVVPILLITSFSHTLSMLLGRTTFLLPYIFYLLYNFIAIYMGKTFIAFRHSSLSSECYFSISYSLFFKYLSLFLWTCQFLSHIPLPLTLPR